MTTLNSVLLSGLSGLRAAQTGLGATSNNIVNANTPGYVRTQVTLSPLSQNGASAGVNVEGVRRAADRFLATASYIAEATRGASAVRADILERAQASFGDPAGGTSMFALLDDYWSALTELGVDPSSSLRRTDAVSALGTMFSEVHRIGDELQQLIAEADQRIGDAVSEVQSLINQISDLNNEIRLNNGVGADITGAQNAQSALIDRLSALLDIRVTPQTEGGVHVRTGGGALLVGIDPAEISYTPNNAPYAAHGTISLNPDLGTQSNLEPFLLGGEIKGLLDLRDRDLVGLSEALGGFAAALGDALNEVHNENTSWPAASGLVGRQTGLLAGDAHGFSGAATIGIVDANGVLRQRLSIDFTAQTITGEAPIGTFSFAGGTIQALENALDAALSAATPSGSASFDGGVLSLNIGQGGGLVIQQDETNPSARAGRGFSHFFGLNDLVSRATPMFFESGVDGADLHGFSAGGELTYRVRDSAGRFVAERTLTVSGALAGPTSDWDDLVTALNATGSGFGDFGTFTLNAATGRLTFAPLPQFQVELVADSTQRGDTGIALSALNGLSNASTAARAADVGLNAAIAGDPLRLAVGRPDLDADIGVSIVEAGDNRGSAALLAARDNVHAFPVAGVLGAQSATLATYASRLGGEAGRLASDAQRSADGARAVAQAAADRRAEVEGVNLDDELMKMTTFQNAYAAAARVVQAATEMLDVLMNIGVR